MMTEDVNLAAARLRSGHVVAFPTETVYGLGAAATNVEAISRVFAIKRRPLDHPLIVHLPHAAMLDDWAREVPEDAWRLARRFWPGPLTLILKRRPGVPDIVTGGQDSVALRVPAHPLALRLLETFGGGIAAPSANRYGRVSPTTAAHVHTELGAEVDLILDGGPCCIGIESTIVSLVAETPVLLRPGAIRASELERVLGVPVALPSAGCEIPRAPGTHAAHYAPRTPLTLLPSADLWLELERSMAAGGRLAVMSFSPLPSPPPATVVVLPMPSNPDDYARMLYATLREVDAYGVDRLLIESPPEEEAWQAVIDRLSRAATHP